MSSENFQTTLGLSGGRLEVFKFFQKVFQHIVSVFGQKGFGVELHAFDRSEERRVGKGGVSGRP